MPDDTGVRAEPGGLARRLAAIEDLAPVAARHLRRAVYEQDAVAPRLNLFEAIGVSRKEVKTHSALLRLLLDPRGEHGQGNLFLRAFLDMLRGKGAPLPEIDESLDVHWQVLVEHDTGDGRLDLLLRNEEAKTWIVVENKIDACDQDGQLWRYWRWLRDETPSDATRVLCYLTIDGDPPSTASTKGARGETRESMQRALVLLSHKRDIGSVLTRTVDRIAAPDVNALVTQYRRLLRSL